MSHWTRFSDEEGVVVDEGSEVHHIDATNFKGTLLPKIPSFEKKLLQVKYKYVTDMSEKFQSCDVYVKGLNDEGTTVVGGIGSFFYFL